MKRLALLHTVLFLADLFKQRLAARYPELDAFHVVDESLLKDFQRAGRLTPNIIRRVATHAGLAQQAGADVILFTCSSSSPAVDVVRPLLDIPILKIDDPMTEKAVQLGRNIGVVCSVESAAQAGSSLLASQAARLGRDVKIVVSVVPEAFEAIMTGDKLRHDRLVGDAAERLSQEADVVVLAQASMSHLAPVLNEKARVPILASLDLCVEALGRYLKD